MKSIKTLIPDIYELVQRKDGWDDESFSQTLADEIANRIRGQFSSKKKGTLRLSRMGSGCPKALWASVNAPETADPFPPWVEIKLAYGQLVEALVIALAKTAGHTVTGEQDELVLDGIVGHRDCVIDGCVVDVKSVSSRQFDKYKNRSIAKDDSFGYLDQLDGYVVASRNDDLVSVKDRGYILAIDKTLGHMVLYEHYIREENIRERIRTAKSIVALDEPPRCTCKTVPEGKSGNIALGAVASYNEFRHFCFPLLRTFLYADGPKYLTKVVRIPDVKEVTKFGRVQVHKPRDGETKIDVLHDLLRPEHVELAETKLLAQSIN